MKNLLLRTGCNAVGVNNGGMKTIQAKKAWDSSNARCANTHSYRTRCACLEDSACKIAHFLFVKNVILQAKYLINTVFYWSQIWYVYGHKYMKCAILSAFTLHYLHLTYQLPQI
jgi:hypothetical protein